MTGCRLQAGGRAVSDPFRASVVRAAVDVSLVDAGTCYTVLQKRGLPTRTLSPQTCSRWASTTGWSRHSAECLRQALHAAGVRGWEQSLPGLTLPPGLMKLALRRRIGPAVVTRGYGLRVDAFVDHYAACMWTGLRQVTSQHWLAHSSAAAVHPADRRRLDFVVYAAKWRGKALCCDVTLVCPLSGMADCRQR